MFALPPGASSEVEASGSDVESGRFRLRAGGRDRPIGQGNYVVGRATDCQLRLGGGLVSRHHACFTIDETGSLTVTDLESRNGVIVNGQRIREPTRLVHGDRVSIGVETLEVVDEQVQARPAHLSTLPPAKSGLVPHDVSDVDAPDLPTMTSRLDILSEREREVLELIVLGHTQREIGQRLHLSPKTVETHRARLSEKLGCSSRAELVACAISAGLLSSVLRRTDRPRGQGGNS